MQFLIETLNVRRHVDTGYIWHTKHTWHLSIFLFLKHTPLFHIIYIITIPFSPAWHKRNVLRLVSCPNVLWLANSLDGVSVLLRPLPKQQVRQYYYFNSDPPRDLWEKTRSRGFERPVTSEHMSAQCPACLAVTAEGERLFFWRLRTRRCYRALWLTPPSYRHPLHVMPYCRM